ncbi:unnamed protein product [Arabidopsis lyrata]|nr:ras-related protein Rab-7a [Arabidopsis lyrata subsp. lyrata]CAH8280603.1 unnamed protein product [Arabidopsis lyrata]|eukprot:XP_002866512.2 ras-related protein Rab-7a [Arabidopsis lyrata subsp. lyrata]
MNLLAFVIGDKGVGKSSLVTKFADDNSPRATYDRISLEHKIEIDIDGRKWMLKIIRGNKTWNCNNKYYYQVACCVLVYDVYNRTSFDNLTKHIDDFVALAHPKAYKFKFVVLGNKIDMRRERAVHKEEALQWCYHNRDALYFETSAIEGDNVAAAFDQIARCATDYIPHLVGGQLYNLQDIVDQHNDLIGLFYESRGRWLEASDVYLIEDHINILLQYLTELPYSPTPGLFLTRTGYTDVSRTVWMDSVFTQLHPVDSDDERAPVKISYACCRMDGKTMCRYIYFLPLLKDLCLVHYMFRQVVNDNDNDNE